MKRNHARGPYTEEDRSALNRAVLEVVLCDFETIESIVHKLSRTDAVPHRVCEVCEIQLALLTLVTDGHVGAYMIHAESPYITAVDPNLDTIERYWLLITEKGEKLLQRKPGTRSRVF